MANAEVTIRAVTICFQGCLMAALTSIPFAPASTSARSWRLTMI